MKDTFDLDNLRRGFTEHNFIKDVVNESESWKKELTKVSESVHYKAPIDKGQVTELQPDLPEVKAVIEKESFDFIWNNGYREGLLVGQIFMTDNLQLAFNNTSEFFVKYQEWIEEKRKSSGIHFFITKIEAENY
jgi:hypothetical protein